MASEAIYLKTKGMVDSFKGGMDATLILQICLQLVFSMSMNLIWGIFNTLQLITNLKRMERIPTPGKVIL